MKRKTIWKITAVAGIAAVAGVVGWLGAAATFVPGDAPVGYMGGLEITNFDLTSGTETVFKTDYEKVDYTGNVYAYPVSAAGVVDRAGERFDGGVGGQINLQNYDTGRKIATMKDDGTKIPFRLASLSAAQKTSLTATVANQQGLLDFVRGDRSNESVGLAFRTRVSVLGDIMHSRPFFLTNGAQPVLLVGANDGMLHAFDASTQGGGAELWAYVPSMLIPTLKNLAANPYVHTYYVDGGLNVGSITVSGVTTKLAVSGLGAGGKGLFAIDVTNPVPADEATLAAMTKWEITPSRINGTVSASYANLGFTYGTPVITKANSSSGESVVIMGNGYLPGGNSHSTLYVINASTGALIREIDTGSGTVASPGGLSTPVCIDTVSTDGRVDFCYAGDVDGNLWKFDLTSTTPASWTATLLHTTSPAQPITMAPAVATHPNGGIMVNFATGKMFTAADKTDATTIYYAYGIWDGAGANAAILTQTLTERAYVTAAGTTRVRVSTANQPTWRPAAAAAHKGWQVALPAGERVLGDTVFIESGRFYFNSYNPTIDNSALVPVTPNGDNWLMEVDYLNGGITTNSPFLDLNGDQLLSDLDRVKYISGDTIPTGQAIGDVILTTGGISVGKLIANGVASHPILVQLASLNTTLFNQNPDVDIPATPADRGVAGGHFDVDIFYGPQPATMCNYTGGSSGAQAQSTITVGSTGAAQAAALGNAGSGGITVGGVVIMNQLTSSDVPNGTANSTVATKIRDKVNLLTSTTGFSATVSGNVVTVKAPIGTTYNTQPFTFIDGTAVGGTVGSSPTATFSISGSTSTNKKITSIKCGTTNLITTSTVSSGSSSTTAIRIRALATGINSNVIGSSGYSISCTTGTAGAGINPSVCTVTGPVGPTACTNLTISKDSSISISTTSPAVSGGALGTAVSNLKPFLTSGGNFSGGVVAVLGTFSSCNKQTHFHEYDDIFNVTGVNMLNASSTTLNLDNAISDTTTPFKVIVHNQYLNPASTLSVGGSVHEGVKTWNGQASETVAANVIANAPTYTRATVNTLEWNLPLNAFSQRDWWGNGDTRVGLMPHSPFCGPWVGSSTRGGNLFYPVIPPATITATGQGTVNYAAADPGVRHNGALTIQIVRADIPSSSIELNVASRPEYGWRVKSAGFETYVLAEYVFYWHHPLGKCYGATGWTKLAALDLSASDPSVWQTPAVGSDDPATGTFRSTSAIISVATTVTTVSGLTVTTTVTTFSNSTTKTVAKTANLDGTTTIVTTYPDGTTTTETVASTAGSVKTGGDEKGSQAQTGRVSWSERLRN